MWIMQLLEFLGGKDKEELINNLHKVFVPESAKSLKETIIAIAEGKTYYKGENQSIRP